jgi:hypothetical protein
MPEDILSLASSVAGGAWGCTRLDNMTNAYGANTGEGDGPCFWFHLQQMPVARDALTVRTWVHEQALRFDERATQFDFSMWHVFVLRYNRQQGAFCWHYDAEDASDFRVLYCLDRTLSAGEVQYKEADGRITELSLAAGEGYAASRSKVFNTTIIVFYIQLLTAHCARTAWATEDPSTPSDS